MCSFTAGHGAAAWRRTMRSRPRRSCTRAPISSTLDFVNVTETGGDLMPMADQVRRAIAWIYKNAASFGGDPNRIYISGHSSGGHLGGVVMVTDWEKDFGLPKDVVKGGLLCSGMYDLKPVRLSARSQLRQVHRRDGARAEQPAPSRKAQRAGDRRLRHAGDTGVPAPDPRLRGSGQGCRQTGRSSWSPMATTTSRSSRRIANPYGLLGRAAFQQMKLMPAQQ